MKKVLFFCALILSTLIVSANNDSLTTKAGKVTDEVLGVIINKTTTAINTLAQSLKIPAEHVFGVIVKQQLVKSIGNLIIMVLGLMLIIILVPISKKTSQDNTFTAFDFLFIVLGIVNIIIIAYTIVMFNDTITGFANPEYNAIEYIRSFIK